MRQDYTFINLGMPGGGFNFFSKSCITPFSYMGGCSEEKKSKKLTNFHMSHLEFSKKKKCFLTHLHENNILFKFPFCGTKKKRKTS